MIIIYSYSLLITRDYSLFNLPIVGNVTANLTNNHWQAVPPKVFSFSGSETSR